MAEKALRVIAVAYKDINVMPSKITSEELENFKTEFINHIRTNNLEIQEN